MVDGSPESVKQLGKEIGEALGGLLSGIMKGLSDVAQLKDKEVKEEAKSEPQVLNETEVNEEPQDIPVPEDKE